MKGNEVSNSFSRKIFNFVVDNLTKYGYRFVFLILSPRAESELRVCNWNENTLNPVTGISWMTVKVEKCIILKLVTLMNGSL